MHAMCDQNFSFILSSALCFGRRNTSCDRLFFQHCSSPWRSIKSCESAPKSVGSGQYTAEVEAQSVEESETLFHEFKLGIFRPPFNKLKNGTMMIVR